MIYDITSYGAVGDGCMDFYKFFQSRQEGAGRVRHNCFRKGYGEIVSIGKGSPPFSGKYSANIEPQDAVPDDGIFP